MNIIVVGATGRMGQMLCGLIERTEGFTTVAKVSPEYVVDAGEHTYQKIAEVSEKADCIIDFSHHSLTAELCTYAKEKHLPLIIATTGQTAEEKEMINNTAKDTAVFFSANMSLGIAMMAKMVSQAAELFGQADIEIIESHHNQKLDVPSGTALLLANAIKEAKPDAEIIVGRHENGKRKPNEIGIHSLRLGTEVGMHEVILTTPSQSISFKHQAHSRELFADGALKAADFICNKDHGLYTMNDIVSQ